MVTHDPRLTRATMLITAGAFVALLVIGCRPQPTLEALNVPPLTLTSIALRSRPEDTSTPRPASPTPSPRASPTSTRTPVPTITPSPAGPATATPGPAEIPAGATLPAMRLGLVFSLIELDMVDPLHGWAIAVTNSDRADHIVRTTDGGLTWLEVSPPQPVLEPLGDDQRAWLAASSPDAAWVTYAGRAGQPLAETWIWRTLDGGQTWRPSAPIAVEDTPTFAPISLGSNAAISWFTLNLSAQADRPEYRLFLTEEGYLWRAIVNPISAWALEEGGEAGCQISDLSFTAEAVGYATGECPAGTAAAARSLDGGRTWAPLAVPDLNSLFAAEAVDLTCTAVSVLYASLERLVAPIRCANQDGALDQDALVTWIGELAVNPIILPGLLAGGTFLDDARGLLLVARNVDADGQVFSPYTLYQTEDGAQTLSTLRNVQWRGPLQSFPDEWVFVLARGDGSANRVLVISDDGGATWALPDPGLVVRD